MHVLHEPVVVSRALPLGVLLPHDARLVERRLAFTSLLSLGVATVWHESAALLTAFGVDDAEVEAAPEEVIGSGAQLAGRSARRCLALDAAQAVCATGFDLGKVLETCSRQQAAVGCRQVLRMMSERSKGQRTHKRCTRGAWCG